MKLVYRPGMWFESFLWGYQRRLHCLNFQIWTTECILKRSHCYTHSLTDTWHQKTHGGAASYNTFGDSDANSRTILK